MTTRNYKPPLIERHLEQLRVSLPFRMVTVYQDTMVYKCPNGLAKEMSEDANAMIEKLNLPLVAIPTTFIRGDSFCVKSNEVEL